eukprot:gb/GECH01000808.1/.p1 GENE.gb/GECH01000808.1/~~gb/GECH01000808.1/.p1  ORF type:complete len:459 (+),score=117.61 gb/GECH01000808.1/:1-1377(+)
MTSTIFPNVNNNSNNNDISNNNNNTQLSSIIRHFLSSWRVINLSVICVFVALVLITSFILIMSITSEPLSNAMPTSFPVFQTEQQKNRCNCSHGSKLDLAEEFINKELHSTEAATTQNKDEPIASNSDGLENSQSDITLVTQITTEKMRTIRLKYNIQRWSGPVSVAVVVNSGQGYQDPAVQDIMKFLRQRSRNNVRIVLYETHQDKFGYPTNILRNLAIAQVETEFMLYIDVDFILSKTAYDYLKSHPEELELVRSKTVLIIPAFRALKSKFRANNKEEAIKHSKILKPFKFHEQTNFTHWWDADEPYNVEWDGNRYFEPYFVVRRNSPNYDERFVGRGCNKISHVWELWLRGYSFRVLPHDFIYHLPHKYHRRDHRPVVTWNCKKLFKKQFKHEMKDRVRLELLKEEEKDKETNNENENNKEEDVKENTNIKERLNNEPKKQNKSKTKKKKKKNKK